MLLMVGFSIVGMVCERLYGYSSMVEDLSSISEGNNGSEKNQWGKMAEEVKEERQKDAHHEYSGEELSEAWQRMGGRSGENIQIAFSNRDLSDFEKRRIMDMVDLIRSEKGFVNNKSISETKIRTYDSLLNETEDEARIEKLSNLAQDEINWVVDTFGVDEDTLLFRYAYMGAIEWEPGDSFYEAIGPERKEKVNPDDAAAFMSTRPRTDLGGNNWKMEKNIYFGENVSESTLAHEMFHFLSSGEEIKYDDSGVGKYKIGISVGSFDKEDNLVDGDHYAVGLNEGLTNVLAMKFTSDIQKGSYRQQTNIANILVTPLDNWLVQAYFSDEFEPAYQFFNNFDIRQGSTTSKELINFSQKAKYVNDNLLIGCIEYATSFCVTPDQLNTEKKRITPIIERILRENWDSTVLTSIQLIDGLKKQESLGNEKGIRFYKERMAAIQAPGLSDDISDFESYRAAFYEKLKNIK